MKFSISLALAALVASVSAVPQSFGGFSMPPSCATQCIMADVQGAGCGTIPNISCVCKNEKVQTSLKTCVPKQCTVKTDVTSFESTINSACKGVVGYPLKISV